MAREHRMIEPFENSQVRAGVISYGVSSYGYDMRVAPEFKIFTNVMSSIVDPKSTPTKELLRCSSSRAKRNLRYRTRTKRGNTRGSRA